jgi:Fic family protein
VRAGEFVDQLGGYRAFIPRALPPERLDIEGLAKALAEAERALGRLDGSRLVIPNPDLFVAMYVRLEAVLSSQIEGTQSSLDDILRFEAERESGVTPNADLEETLNYVRAMNHGLDRLRAGAPLDLTLLREIHRVLMTGIRGGDRGSGEFRDAQNWIGGNGARIEKAIFVPPPPEDMLRALKDLEMYLHDRRLPDLLVAGLAHAQFETIHPFRDGNGRIGRLLITLMLCHRGLLHQPLLYLSLHLKRHRRTYYTLLQSIRTDGDWEEWLRFLLDGVRMVADEAAATARSIADLRERHRALVAGSKPAFRLLEALYQSPYMTANRAAQMIDAPFKTANQALERLVAAGLLVETTGRRRGRVFKYSEYVGLFGGQAQ